MKKDRLEEATEGDKKTFIKVLKRIDSKKPSKLNGSSEARKSTKSKKRSSKNSKVRRRCLKDGSFENKMKEDKNSKPTTQILIVLTNKS